MHSPEEPFEVSGDASGNAFDACSDSLSSSSFCEIPRSRDLHLLSK
jgi:hypothetical protein